MVSRRKLLIGGGVAAAAIAVPGVQHWRWNARDFSRDDYIAGLPEAPPGEVGWMNWSGIQRATPEQIAVPASEDALATLLRDTTAPVRPVGSGHSFSGLVPTEGILVDVSRLNGLLDVDVQARQVTFGAGTRLRQAARAMNDVGLAFANLPDIDVQTLAGTFSTATHGTGAELTALHDYIRGFRLVTAGGEVVDVDARSHPDLFAAGRVSLGALGLITRYILAVEPAFALRRRVWVEPLEALLASAEAMAREHRNFEFYYFPNTGHGAVIVHDRHEGPVSGRGPGEDDELLSDLEDLRDVFGWSGWLRRRIIADALPEGVVEDYTDDAWRLLSTARPNRFNEMEYEMPLATGLDTLARVIDYMDSRGDVYYPMEVRFVAADDAWLSPFNAGPRLAISVHAAVDEPYEYFFSDLEPIFRAGGGRPHWGKLHGLGHAELAAEYPRLNDFAALRAELDPAGRLLNEHLMNIFGAKG